MGRMLSTYTIDVCHDCAEHMANGTGKVNLDWDAYPHAVLETVGEPEFTGGGAGSARRSPRCMRMQH